MDASGQPRVISRDEALRILRQQQQQPAPAPVATPAAAASLPSWLRAAVSATPAPAAPPVKLPPGISAVPQPAQRQQRQQPQQQQRFLQQQQQQFQQQRQQQQQRVQQQRLQQQQQQRFQQQQQQQQRLSQQRVIEQIKQQEQQRLQQQQQQYQYGEAAYDDGKARYDDSEYYGDDSAATKAAPPRLTIQEAMALCRQQAAAEAAPSAAAAAAPAAAPETAGVGWMGGSAEADEPLDAESVLAVSSPVPADEPAEAEPMEDEYSDGDVAEDEYYSDEEEAGNRPEYEGKIESRAEGDAEPAVAPEPVAVVAETPALPAGVKLPAGVNLTRSGPNPAPAAPAASAAPAAPAAPAAAAQQHQSPPDQQLNGDGAEDAYSDDLGEEEEGDYAMDEEDGEQGGEAWESANTAWQYPQEETGAASGAESQSGDAHTSAPAATASSEPRSLTLQEAMALCRRQAAGEKPAEPPPPPPPPPPPRRPGPASARPMPASVRQARQAAAAAAAAEAPSPATAVSAPQSPTSPPTEVRTLPATEPPSPAEQATAASVQETQPPAADSAPAAVKPAPPVDTAPRKEERAAGSVEDEEGEDALLREDEDALLQGEEDDELYEGELDDEGLEDDGEESWQGPESGGDTTDRVAQLPVPQVALPPGIRAVPVMPEPPAALSRLPPGIRAVAVQEPSQDPAPDRVPKQQPEQRQSHPRGLGIRLPAGIAAVPVAASDAEPPREPESKERRSLDADDGGSGGGAPAASSEPRHLTLQEAMAMYRQQSQTAEEPEPPAVAAVAAVERSAEPPVEEDDSLLLDDTHLAEREARFNEDEYDDDLDQEDFDEDEDLMKNGGWHDDASPQYQSPQPDEVAAVPEQSQTHEAEELHPEDDSHPDGEPYADDNGDVEDEDSRLEEDDSRLEEDESRVGEEDSAMEEGESRPEEGESRPEEGESRPEEDQPRMEEGDSEPEASQAHVGGDQPPQDVEVSRPEESSSVDNVISPHKRSTSSGAESAAADGYDAETGEKQPPSEPAAADPTEDAASAPASDAANESSPVQRSPAADQPNPASPSGSGESPAPAAGEPGPDSEQPAIKEGAPESTEDSSGVPDQPASEAPAGEGGSDGGGACSEEQQLGDDSLSDLISGAVMCPELMQAEVDGTAEDLSEVKDMLSMLEEKPDLLDGDEQGELTEGDDEEQGSSEADDSGSESDRRDGASDSGDGGAESDAAGDGKRESPKPKRRKKKGRKRKKKRTDSKDDDESGPRNKRRNIRQIITDEKLDTETLRAQEEEKERQLRLAEQKKWYEQFKREQERVEREKEEERLEQEAAEAERKAKQKADDVIVLSSDEEKQEKAEPDGKLQVKLEPGVGAETSDDDIQLLSSEEEDNTHAEDSNNSGSHTDDTCNVPDSLGRVLVNVGHPPAEMDIFIASQIARTIKPHQIGGVRFLYDNLIESQERCKTTPGFGCILAHSMGLGKTMQTVTFADIFLRHTSHRTVLIIVPINTIQNWLNEFNYWLPDANTYTPLAQGGEVRPRHFAVSMVNDSHRTLQARAKVIGDWYRDGGVLLIGYELYRLLNISSSRAARKKKRKDGSDDLEAEAREKQLLEGIKVAITRPGPDLVICDEGHRIKNAGASISQALKSIRTRRRLGLTGYPLQNSLVEYWCMVDFVRPNFLGTKAEFNNMFERPISNGQCVDSTPSDVRLMRFRAHVLHSLLEGLVQRRSHAILQAALPKKEEYVFLLRMTKLQRALYQRYMLDLTTRNGHSSNPLRAFVVSCKIWNHPDILYNLMRKKMADEDLDLDETNDSASSGTASRPRRLPPQPPGAGPAGAAGNSQTPLEANPLEKPKEDGFINYDWAQEMMQNYIPGQLENSSKMMVFKVLLEETVKQGDKMLLFSQSLFTLNIIEEFLQQTVIPGRNEKWMLNQSYYRLDGSTTGLEREKLINEFNVSPAVPLFLVSTRAGSLGVNLVGANRVLVFDASWNPCHDTQAVCRVYRFGQRKECYIYRLVTDNCLERRIYDRQLKKQSMSNRIVDETNPDNMVTTQSLSRLLDPNEDDPPPATISPDPDKYDDPVMLTLLSKLGHLFSQEPFEHDAQLADRHDKRLTQAEKRLAKRSYELEKKAAHTGRPNAQGFYPRGGPGSHPGGYRYNKPVANVRPMMVSGRMVPQRGGVSPFAGVSRLSTEQLSRQGVSMSHITVPKDVTIPTGSGDGAPIQLRAGQTVLVIRTAKGVYLRLQDGRIIAIRMPPGSGDRSVPDLLNSSRYQTRPQAQSAAGPSGIRLPRGITVERVPASGGASGGRGGASGGAGRGGKQSGQSWARRAAPARAAISRSAPARSDSDSGDGGLSLSSLLGRQAAPKAEKGKGKSEQPAASAASVATTGATTTSTTTATTASTAADSGAAGAAEKQAGEKPSADRTEESPADSDGSAASSAMEYLDRALAETADGARPAAAGAAGVGGSPAAGPPTQEDPNDPLARLKSLAVAASGAGSRQEGGMTPSSVTEEKQRAAEQQQQQQQQMQTQSQQLQQQMQTQSQHQQQQQQQQQHRMQTQPHHLQQHHQQQQQQYQPDLQQQKQQLPYPEQGQMPLREPTGRPGEQLSDTEFMDTHIFDLSHKARSIEQQSAQDLSGGGQGLDLTHLPPPQQQQQQHPMSSRPQQQQQLLLGSMHGQMGGQPNRLGQQLGGQQGMGGQPMAGHQGRLDLQLGGQPGRMGHPLDSQQGLSAPPHSRLEQQHRLGGGGGGGGGTPVSSMSQLDQRLGLSHGHPRLSQPHDLSMHGQQPAPGQLSQSEPPRYGMSSASQFGGAAHQGRGSVMDQPFGSTGGGGGGSQHQPHRQKSSSSSRSKPSGYAPHQPHSLHQPHLQLAPEPSHSSHPSHTSHTSHPSHVPHLSSGIDDLIAGFDLTRPTYSSAPAPPVSSSLSAGLSGGVSNAPLPSFSTVSQLPLPSFSSMTSSGGSSQPQSQPSAVREPLPQPMDTAPASAPPTSSSSSSRLAEEPFPWELGAQYPSYGRELGYAGYPPYGMGYSQPPAGYGVPTMPAPYPSYGLYGAAASAAAAGYSPYRYPAGYQAFSGLGGGAFGGLGGVPGVPGMPGVPGLPQPYPAGEPAVSAADFSLGSSMSAPGDPIYRRPQ